MMIPPPGPAPQHRHRPPVPAWLRGAIAQMQGLATPGLAPAAHEDVALAAGAALGALDAIVRSEPETAGAWRQRLALAAAAVTARQAGRVEDEAGLRDALLLTRPGDDVGPAGRLLLAWRRLAAQPAAELLAPANLAAVLDEFGHADDGEAIAELGAALAAELRRPDAGISVVGMLTSALTAVERYGFGNGFGCWLADALLARRLGWTHAVPLLGSEETLGIGSARTRRAATVAPAAGAEADPGRAKNLLAAQARAALRAIDLSAELGRRADRLTAVAPRLRAKGADAIVERLLNDDALVASRGEQTTGISDRGLRRLFDRLVDLGAVRELSGRPTFRIYGL